jgi:membrane associated rhomboid family serine protease
VNRNMGPQIQFRMPFTPTVKKLVIINVVIWFVFTFVIEQFFLSHPFFTLNFGLVPQSVLSKFFVWQPVSYMFMHSLSPWHLLFNMLMLWMIGGELETRWGSRFFLMYYFVCGVGAGILYFLFTVFWALASNQASGLVTPMIGASGSVFGLMLAYAILFGERTIMFLMIFPMKAKYAMMIFGALLVFSLLGSLAPGATDDGIAHMAHLGGVISGFLFLLVWNRRLNKVTRKKTTRHGRKLKLVVSNDDKSEQDGPKYWN